MVWRDVNTLHKITEIGINSFERNLWNVMRHLQDSKFGLGVFFILFMRENVAESRASSACFTILSCGQCVAMVLVFLRMVSKHCHHCF